MKEISCHIKLVSKNTVIIIINVMIFMSELVFFVFLFLIRSLLTLHKVDWSKMIPHEVYVAHFVGWSGIFSAVKPGGVPQ